MEAAQIQSHLLLLSNHLDGVVVVVVLLLLLLLLLLPCCCGGLSPPPLPVCVGVCVGMRMNLIAEGVGGAEN